MADTTIVGKLLARNKTAVETYQPRPYFSEFPSLGLELPKVLILTCVDPRVSPEKFLDLGPVGPVIFRNVCGHVTPALVDIMALDSIVSLTDIVIIHHTDCGSLLMKDENIRAFIRESLPDVKNVDSLKFPGIVDVAQSVKDDLAILKASPLIRKELLDRSHGFVLDVKTGVISSV